MYCSPGCEDALRCFLGCTRPEGQAEGAQDTSSATDTEQEAACAAIVAAVDEVVGEPTKEEVTAALRAQLEQGNVVRPSHPVLHPRMQVPP